MPIFRGMVILTLNVEYSRYNMVYSGISLNFRAKDEVKMKVLFLHIGDLHIKNSNGINEFQIKKIADSINVCVGCDKLILAITGDITHSGESGQYDVAYRCIGKIITSIKTCSNYKGDIEVVCVPGNHDIDHMGSSRTSEELREIRISNSYEKNLAAEVDKQKAFFNFARRNKCFLDNQILFQRAIDINGFVIEVNMINSGVFSIFEEDKGLHYIPLYCINEFIKPTGADFVITIMHHSPDWYIDNQKRFLEEAIYVKSSLVFFGHEHYLGKKTVAHENNPPALIQAGGCLCVNDNWINSSYHVGLLDTDNMNYTQIEFQWNSEHQQYAPIGKVEQVIDKKPSVEKRINMTQDFLENFCVDPKHEISKDFRDYFVFPRIQGEDLSGTLGKEFTDEDAFIAEILKRKKLLITGGYNSGKTALLKSLFFRLTNDGYFVLFCDINNIRGKRAERIIRNCFEDIYGEKPSDYDRFLQLPKEKLVLIIDDTDLIESSDFEKFVSQLGDTFEYFIFASNKVLDMNLIERMKVFLKTKDLLFRFNIAPFFNDKRVELIRKVVTILAEDLSSIENTTKFLTEAIKAQRRFISLDPDFIIKYVVYFCRNIGEAKSNDSGVFSKVFEAGITNAISKHQTQLLSVDKIFILLSMIAYYIHFNKAYPIQNSSMQHIIDDYNFNFGDSVNGVDAINIMVKSKILLEAEGGGYRFSNKNYLAFFVAHEVLRQFNDTGDDKDLQIILKCSCFGINSDILLFISYITDNIRILRLILYMANEYSKGWEEFTFGDNMPDFLKKGHKHTIDLPDPDEKKEDTKDEIAVEKAISDELRTVELYDYIDAEADSFINQIIRACSLLIVVAKCLPNFEYMMKAPDKIAFVDTIYRLPNKIFQKWANAANHEIDELIKFFRQQSQDYFLKQKVVTNDDIFMAIQWSSMSFLLELYNVTSLFSTKDNTITYLDNFDYSENDAYGLEHLMMLEKQNNSYEFTKAAIEMNENNKDLFYSASLARTVKHALAEMTDMGYKDVQKLQSQFFVRSEEQRFLIAQRIKSNMKENG